MNIVGSTSSRKGFKFGDFHRWGSSLPAPDGGLLLVLSFSNSNWLIPGGLRVLRLTDDFEVLSETILYDDVLGPNDATMLPDGSLV
ncbi:MAG: hypothetical protein H6574_17640 [Lewinellaceae bacterium]|nr:hypothetical protein [Lewinellaceae bacterium]